MGAAGAALAKTDFIEKVIHTSGGLALADYVEPERKGDILRDAEHVEQVEGLEDHPAAPPAIERGRTARKAREVRLSNANAPGFGVDQPGENVQEAALSASRLPAHAQELTARNREVAAIERNPAPRPRGVDDSEAAYVDEARHAVVGSRCVPIAE